jgi:DNA-binding transcriptional ArsR family regulator
MYRCSNHRAILKELNDETRKRIEEALKGSAAKYADHTENTISKLEQAYLKKCHPLQYAHSTEDVPNKTFGSRVSTLFRGRQERAKSEDGIADITQVFQLGLLLIRPSELDSDDDCRRAVSQLNDFRSIRAEDLGYGYDVSDIFILWY